MNNAINKISIPDWWAEILDRINLPYGAEGYLMVETPFKSDYRNMVDFWEDLEDVLGFSLFDWVEQNLDEEQRELFFTIQCQTNFVLAYMNAYSRPLFEVYETSYNSVI